MPTATASATSPVRFARGGRGVGLLSEETRHAVAIQVAADAELHGGAFERVGEAALVVVARVGHARVAARVRLGQRRAVGEADGQPADDRVFLGQVFVPPVGRPENVVEPVHHGPSRDVRELPAPLGPDSHLIGLERLCKGGKELEMLTHG